MERKVGEIFEYNGEWYQCIHTKSLGCENCDLATKSDIHCSDVFEIRGECLSCYRKDGKSVIFKKLEKVGDPYVAYGLTRQKYKLHVPLVITDEILDEDILCDEVNGIVYIRAKQNKENMEEKKLNLKEFDLEAAKAGKPVCTRDGRKARIICFDAKCNKPIVALIYDCNKETVLQYLENGRFFVDQIDKYDLMMLPEKKEGWVNIYNRNRPRTSSENCYIMTGVSVFETKEGAISYIDKDKEYIDTVKIEWEE